MTLLLTAFAAIICTILWYVNASARELKIGILTLMFWGATLMWLVDAIVEYAELGAAYFTPAFSDMLNDTFLGLSVIVLGLIIWLVIIIIKDPRGVVHAALRRDKMQA